MIWCGRAEIQTKWPNVNQEVPGAHEPLISPEAGEPGRIFQSKVRGLVSQEICIVGELYLPFFSSSFFTRPVKIPHPRIWSRDLGISSRCSFDILIDRNARLDPRENLCSAKSTRKFRENGFPEVLIAVTYLSKSSRNFEKQWDLIIPGHRTHDVYLVSPPLGHEQSVQTSTILRGNPT